MKKKKVSKKLKPVQKINPIVGEIMKCDNSMTSSEIKSKIDSKTANLLFNAISLRSEISLPSDSSFIF
jgi:hypothetical protein